LHFVLSSTAPVNHQAVCHLKPCLHAVTAQWPMFKRQTLTAPLPRTSPSPCVAHISAIDFHLFRFLRSCHRFITRILHFRCCFHPTYVI